MQAADISKTAATVANAFTNTEGVLKSIDPRVRHLFMVVVVARAYRLLAAIKTAAVAAPRARLIFYRLASIAEQVIEIQVPAILFA